MFFGKSFDEKYEQLMFDFFEPVKVDYKDSVSNFCVYHNTAIRFRVVNSTCFFNLLDLCKAKNKDYNKVCGKLKNKSGMLALAWGCDFIFGVTRHAIHDLFKLATDINFDFFLSLCEADALNKSESCTEDEEDKTKDAAVSSNYSDVKNADAQSTYTIECPASSYVSVQLNRGISPVTVEQPARKKNQVKVTSSAKADSAFASRFVSATHNMLVRDYAKHVKQAFGLHSWGMADMFNWFINRGYMNLNYYPSQKAMDVSVNGKRVFYIHSGVHQEGDILVTHHTTKITPAGIYYFDTKIAEDIKRGRVC